MIKVDMDVLPRALAEIVPGVTVNNATSETVSVTVILDKVPAAPAVEAPAVNGVSTPHKLPHSDAGR